MAAGVAGKASETTQQTVAQAQNVPLKQGPMVVVVGETASGKSAAGMELAERLGGEIICADSRTVYRGMDIGTAKPSPDERARVPHHCLDLAAPDEPFSVAQFKECAERAIEGITKRGKLPIMVGGTGLYVDAVLYDYHFREPADPAERTRLQAMTVEELQSELTQKGIPLPTNARNPRHLTRSLETGGAESGRSELRPNTIIVGLRPDRSELDRRIDVRISQMVDAGFIAEVQRLLDRYGPQVPALQAPGYKAFREYVEGQLTLEEAKAFFARNDRNLAKRQRTWFRRNNSIHWFENREELIDYVVQETTTLNN